MVRAGIVGLPNVGKSTLFNAVTRTRKAQAANYPFCTIRARRRRGDGAGQPAGLGGHHVQEREGGPGVDRAG